MGGDRAYVVVDVSEDFLRCDYKVDHFPYCRFKVHACELEKPPEERWHSHRAPSS